MSVWRDRAQRLIAELTADLPAEATLAERRKVLWGKGYPAHGGTVWGRKMWGQEVRRYLARHGGAPLRSKHPQFRFPDHVYFPFREGSDA